MSTVLAQARLRACRHWPFASHAILLIIPVPRPGLGTLAVDKHWRLYHDEAPLERMDVEPAAGLILHGSPSAPRNASTKRAMSGTGCSGRSCRIASRSRSMRRVAPISTCTSTKSAAPITSIFWYQ
jgi:hypothetical protein